jgi:hypothetical protein
MQFDFTEKTELSTGLGRQNAGREGRKRVPSVFSVRAYGLYGAAIKGFLAKLLFFGAAGLFDDEGMPIVLIHIKMVGSDEDAGVTGNTFPVHVVFSRYIFVVFVVFVRHNSPFTLIEALI